MGLDSHCRMEQMTQKHWNDWHPFIDLLHSRGLKLQTECWVCSSCCFIKSTCPSNTAQRLNKVKNFIIHRTFPDRLHLSSSHHTDFDILRPKITYMHYHLTLGLVPEIVDYPVNEICF